MALALAGFVGSWRWVQNESKLLSRLGSGPHSPDVDDHSASHGHSGLFLQCFVGAVEALTPLHNGPVIGPENVAGAKLT